MSVPIIIDEWLFHDLAGGNGEEKQYQTHLFIAKLLSICDKIVILKGSPFHKKMNDFLRLLKTSPDPKTRGVAHYFREVIFFNSSKIEYIEKNQIKSLPSDLSKIIHRKDEYLFQSYLAIGNTFIVTGDEKLKEKLITKKSIKIHMRDEFIKEYLS